MVKTNSFYTLHGKTGVGKTAVLRALQNLGYPVLDLEALAFHKGSLFGVIDKKQPTKFDFRSLCENILRNHKNELPLFSEWKGTNVGKLKIPFEVISRMNNGISVVLDRSLEERTLRLLETYQTFDFKNLYNSLFLLQDRMQPDHFQAALKALDDGIPVDFIGAILPYYDERYEAQIKSLENKIIQINCTGKDDQQIASAVLKSII